VLKETSSSVEYLSISHISLPAKLLFLIETQQMKEIEISEI
jgi:hypothetical protein